MKTQMISMYIGPREYREVFFVSHISQDVLYWMLNEVLECETEGIPRWLIDRRAEELSSDLGSGLYGYLNGLVRRYGHITKYRKNGTRSMHFMLGYRVPLRIEVKRYYAGEPATHI